MLALEDLTGLVRKEFAIGEFLGFSVKEKCEVDILQFMDETFLIEDVNWKHLGS